MKAHRMMLTTYLLGVFMGALDIGIVAPALTTIIGDLHATPQWSIWIVTAYGLVYAMGMPIFGKLSDRYGRRRLFMAGVAIFGVGSLLSGLAHSIIWLILARSLQALGGGGIFPVAAAAMGDAFPPERRGVALGLIGGVYGFANIIAPNLGGFLISHLGWQAIFFVNVPIAAIVLLLATRLQGDAPDAAPSKLDLPGVLVVSLAILSWMLAFTNLDPRRLGASLLQPDVGLLLLAGIVLVPIVLAVERRQADPLLPPHLLRHRPLLIAYVLTILGNATMVSLLFLPGFTQNLLHISAGASGYLITPLALATFVSAPGGGALINRMGAGKVLAMGFFLTGAGLWYLTAAHVLGSVIVGLFVVGLGMGLTAGSPLNYIIIDEVSDDERGTALGVQHVVGALGMVLIPTVMAAQLGSAVDHARTKIGAVMAHAVVPYVAAHPQAAPLLAALRKQYESASVTPGALSSMLAKLPPTLHEVFATRVLPVLEAAVLRGFREILVLGAVLAAAGVLVSFAVRSCKRPGPDGAVDAP